MAKSPFPPQSPPRWLAACLLAVAVGACSFDASKLRAPAARALDGPVEASASPGADVADGNGDPTRGDSARREILDDVAGGLEAANSGDVSPPMEAASAGETTVPDGATSPADVPSGTGEGGSGGGGATDTSPDGSGTGGRGTGGSGGTGGADAARDVTGHGGTGGADMAADGGRGGADAGVDGTGGGGTAGTDAPSGGTGGSGDTAEAGAASGETGGDGADAGGVDGGGPDDVAAPGPDPDLVLWYKFDESGGTIAADAAMFAGVARNATLATIGVGASAVFSTPKWVGANAIALTPSAISPSTGGAYVIIPSFAALAPGAITIAVWVYLPANTPTQTWERIFDCGNSSTGMNWLNLMARSGDAPSGPVEFAMSNTGHGETEALIGRDPLSTNVWHHIAIVLPDGAPYTGTMYIDGVAVASNNAMTLHMADIGATSNNWLGRSQFSNDPFFNGSLDDFRVYKRALSKQEITALMAVR